jgi:hypothetical protein
MRTTVDLPEDTLRRVKNIAADRRTSVSKVIADYVQKAVDPPTEGSYPRYHIEPDTGFMVVDLGYPVTSEDVRRALDDE